MKKSERKSEKSLVLEVARSTEVVAEVVKILVKDSSSYGVDLILGVHESRHVLWSVFVERSFNNELLKGDLAPEKLAKLCSYRDLSEEELLKVLTEAKTAAARAFHVLVEEDDRYEEAASLLKTVCNAIRSINDVRVSVGLFND